MAKNNGHFSSVLVTRFSALGDVAIAVPVLYDVCRLQPGTRFVFVTRSAFVSIFVNAPANLEVVGVDLNNYKGMAGLWRLASQLHSRYGTDAYADLHSVLRTWVIGAYMRLHGVKTAVIDKGRGEKKALVSGKIKRQLTPTATRYANVFAALGLNYDEAFTSVFDHKPAAAKRLFPFAKAEGQRWVAVAPFSQHQGKNYPLDMMELVVEALVELPGVAVFLFGGGKREAALLRGIVGRHQHNVFSVADIKHDFSQELAFMSECDAMVSMDSANMHLASLVGLPVVSVWGATHPYCGFMGWKQSLDNAVQRTDIDCRPCSVFGQKPCRYADYRCMTGIEPQVIIEKVKNLLQL